jgi:hypothetical protein
MTSGQVVNSGYKVGKLAVLQFKISRLWKPLNKVNKAGDQGLEKQTTTPDYLPPLERKLIMRV